ncbi:aminotransferase class I/II-fold pyridoxal phosphate-dependent enzyme [Pseudoduganella sp. FT55W]|uniref:Aminotransferase class I/II-fold pyridoxal phosphate-dependent enzyme n=1 Tax=Duganella rivi TaxID=2666083 RepID=A0A7X4GLN0_9BURK|nr:amino acid aminotransferase [Duganella rivi]MYM65743.1 aminotransferase class I/II-fold pyridoxal phosphate-dependent enzyme [Duganella rivi]
MFQHVEAFAGDPILTLNEQFAADPRPAKINLSIGVYLNDEQRIPLMGAVAAAEERLAQSFHPHPYLPMAGLPAYRAQSRALVFGDAHAERIATIQTLGGSGALKVGADFLKAWFPQARVWVSDPTWDNHKGIFGGAGFEVGTYPYYDRATHGVAFDAMLSALRALPAGDIVVLHACCHNPTGADLNQQQWRELALVVQERGLLPFFDIAYQGFGDGIAEDAFAIRHFAQLNIPLLVASSYSKNFAIYGERCGALHVSCKDAAEMQTVSGQLQSAVRKNYSSPPAYGARVIATVLEDQQLRAQWEAELGAMRQRMKQIRSELLAQLQAQLPGGDFDYLRVQQGMFSFTGLPVEQIRKLRDVHGVYLIESGRVCLAALSSAGVAPVARAMVQVMTVV